MGRVDVPIRGGWALPAKLRRQAKRDSTLLANRQETGRRSEIRAEGSAQRTRQAVRLVQIQAVVRADLVGSRPSRHQEECP